MKRYKVGSYGAMVEDENGQWVEHAALAAPAPQPADGDGSVMVRIDRVYVDAMRGDGLTGPFACVRLVEHEGEPRLELTTAPVPTPDTADWWREVAQGLGVEIAKMKALVSAPACVATTPQGDVCGLCGRPSADHRGPENAAAPAPAVGEAAPPFPDQCEVGESMASDHPTAHQAWTAIRNMPPEQWEYWDCGHHWLWRPIETAPKRTDVLAGWADRPHWLPQVLQQDDAGMWFNGEESDYRPPTHWMPLPAPPQAETKGDES